MRFAELYCQKCGTFMITFDNDIPKQKHMFCPVCGIDNVDIVKIDGK